MPPGFSSPQPRQLAWCGGSAASIGVRSLELDAVTAAPAATPRGLNPQSQRSHTGSSSPRTTACMPSSAGSVPGWSVR